MRRALKFYLAAGNGSIVRPDRPNPDSGQRNGRDLADRLSGDALVNGGALVYPAFDR
jgi:hypothetical protein